MRDSPGGLKELGVTQLLRAWAQGDEEALEQLAPLVENELHHLARKYMRRERPGQPLQTTELVNEVYLRLIDAAQVSWQDRAHFFAVSARMMRRILTDQGRAVVTYYVTQAAPQWRKAFYFADEADEAASGAGPSPKPEPGPV